MTKLHIGCGERNFGKDWVHIDGNKYDHIDYSDIKILEFKDNSVDLIYASHLIAYFDRDEINGVLQEWNRVLKPNGVLRIATPDFDAMVKLYLTREVELEQILGPLYGKWDLNGQIYHKPTYSFKSLYDLLFINGFININTYDWRETNHSHFDDHSQAYYPHMNKENGTLISLNIECKKI